MYMCEKCGYTTEELITYKEYHPYSDGYACEEVADYDCTCGGNFEIAEECEECGELMCVTNLRGGICQECDEELDEIMNVEKEVKIWEQQY